MKRLRNSVIKWIVVSLICLLLGFLLGEFKQNILTEKLSVLKVDLEAMMIRNEKLQTDFSRLQTESIVAEQTVASLVKANKLLQDEIALVNNKVFFYQRVIAPELDTEGVKVHSFEISKDQQTQAWKYELVLMQSQKGRRFLTGKYDISFSVFEGDELTLVSIKEFTEEKGNGFKFKFFQTIQGSFILPEQVDIDEVVLKLNVKGNRWYKEQFLETRYDWRLLTGKNVDGLSEFDSSDNNTEQTAQ